MFIKRIFLYYHTLKFLKFRQLWTRGMRYLFPLTFWPHKENPVLRRFSRKWQQVIPLNSPILKEHPLTFFLLNHEGSIESREDWNNPNFDKLWLYTLHYHAFLLSDASSFLKQKIMEQWVEQNPWPFGVGWEPYPLSLRIVNWIKYFMTEESEKNSSLQESLYLQCCSLEHQIEYHLLGNHLFENGKALFFAGLYFKTKKSKRWLKKGLSLLSQELQEQVLTDGGHFERSPMYHALILEGLLDIYQLLSIGKSTVERKARPSLEKLEALIQKNVPSMLQWLSSLSHPDGNIAFFNDATGGVASHPRDIYEYALFLGFNKPKPLTQLLHLKESGFGRAENKEILLLADLGSVGPSYIPGHAHAGTLSFEMSLRGERFFVNSGISTYTPNEERHHQRGTLAHNTILIDEQNSSQTWSSFRVGKRARILDVHYNSHGFTASHDGYKNSKYKLIHNREWLVLEKAILIKDTLKGKGSPQVTSSFHLHPQWVVLSQTENEVNIQSLNTQHHARLIFPTDSEIRLESYDYALGFNLKQKGICLRICLTNKKLPYSLETVLEW